MQGIGGIFAVSLLSEKSLADQGSSIDYGDTAAGTVDDTLVFDAEEGDEISIDVRIDEPWDNEVEVELYRPNGDRVARSVGNAEDGNAAITSHTVGRGRSGEYTIGLSSSRSSAGDTFGYELSIFQGLPIDEEISYGESIEGELTRGDRYYADYYITGYHDTYAFEAAEGDEITIEMRPNDEVNNDAQLVLYNPDGDRVTTDTSQSGEDGNAVITFHEVERDQDGQYTIVATGASDTDLFEYEMFLYEGLPVDEEISYGESIEGELTRGDRYYADYYITGYHDTYAFEAAEGDEITIEMRPDDEVDNDAQLALYDPDGDLVTTDTSQSGEDGNAVITLYEVDSNQDGQYTIVATGASDTDLFEYELFLYQGLPIDEEISYGGRIDRELMREDRYYDDFYINGYHHTYSFEALDDNVVTIEMRPDGESDDNAQLALYDPDGDLVTNDTNQRGDGGTALITEQNIEMDGTHTIVATGNTATELFTYSLEVTLDEGTRPDQANLQIQPFEIDDATAEDSFPVAVTIEETEDAVAEDTEVELTVESPSDDIVYEETITAGDVEGETTVTFGQDNGTDELGPFTEEGEYTATVEAEAEEIDLVSVTEEFSVETDVEDPGEPAEEHESGVDQDIFDAVDQSGDGDVSLGELQEAVGDWSTNQQINGVEASLDDLRVIVNWWAS